MASEAEQKLYRHAFTAMGSPCELQLQAPDPSLAQRVAGRAMADVRRLEARYSRYLPDSFLSAINRIAAEGGSIDVDEETGGLLDYADTCHRESEGLFDITTSGHVIIEEENRGRILILDSAGQLVADFVNRAPDGQVYGLGWSRYVTRAAGDAALEQINKKTCG